MIVQKFKPCIDHEMIELLIYRLFLPQVKTQFEHQCEKEAGNLKVEQL